MSNKGKIKVTERKLVKSNPYKNDVLYTEDGQKKYPGSITRIPSGDITMSNVNFPVIGVDNLGNKKLMQPNHDYQFPGDSVTEFPILKSGGLTKEKAHQMLIDNSAHGKPLTDKQKKYFGMLSHSNHKHGGTHFHKSHAPFNYSERSRINEALHMDYGGPTNINLMKNTFSRKLGGAPMNDHYSIPSFMEYGGMFPYGGTPDIGSSMTQTAGSPQYNESQLQAMGYSRLPGYTGSGDSTQGDWVDPKTGDTRFYKPGMQMQNYNQPVVSSIAKPTIPTVPVNPALPIRSGSSMGTGYTINQQQPDTNIYKGVRPAKSQQNIFQKIKYGTQDLLHKEGGSHFDSPDSNKFEEEKNNFLNWLKETSLDALHEEMIPHAQFYHMPDGSIISQADMDQEEEQMKKGGSKKNWLKGAVNPAHKGYCTPMTKSTCTPRRKAFAMTMKKHHGFHKQMGGTPSLGNGDLSHEYMMGGNFPMDIKYQYGGNNPINYIPENKTIGKTNIEGYGNPINYMGDQYHDMGISYTNPKGNFDINAGNYFPQKMQGDEKPVNFNPYIGVNYNTNKGSIGAEAYPGYIGARFTKTFNDGGDISIPDLHNDFKKGGYTYRHRRPTHRTYSHLYDSPSSNIGGLSGMNSYCGGKITEACITAALNDPDPRIRKKAAFAKQMHGVHMALGGGVDQFDNDALSYNHGGEKRWEQTALMEWQSGGGMNAGTPQDWGYNPQATNAVNYYTAWQQANQQNDLGNSFINLAGATSNLQDNKQTTYTGKYTPPKAAEGYLVPGSNNVWDIETDSNKYADILTKTRYNNTDIKDISKPEVRGNYNGYPHNPYYGTYGFGYGRGSDWFPMNKYTGHNDFLPSPKHRIKGFQEHLTPIDPNAYLSKVDLKYGLFNRSSPKRIHMEFNKPKYSKYTQEQIDVANPTHPTITNNTSLNNPAEETDFMKMYTPPGPRAEQITPPYEEYFDTGKTSGTRPHGKYGIILKKAQSGFEQYSGQPQNGPRAEQSQFEDPNFWTNESANKFLGKAKETVGNITQTAIEQPTNRQAQETAIRKANEAVGYEGPENPAGTLDFKKRTKYNSEDLANWGLASMEAATSLINQGDIRKKELALRNRTHADMVFSSLPQNVGSRGDYDTNSGMFRPDQDVPIQYQGQQGFKKMGGQPCYNCGGQYQVGGEVEMTDEEVQQFLEAGGELEMLD